MWPDSWWSAPPGDACGARHRRVALAHGAWSEPTCRTRHLLVSVESAVLPVTVGRGAVRSTSDRPIPCGGLAPKASRGTPSSSSPPSVNGLPCGVRWLPSRCRCSWTSGRSPHPDGAARPPRPGPVNSVVYSYRSPYLLSLGVLTTSQCARFSWKEGRSAPSPPESVPQLLPSLPVSFDGVHARAGSGRTTEAEDHLAPVDSPTPAPIGMSTQGSGFAHPGRTAPCRSPLRLEPLPDRAVADRPDPTEP